MLIAEADGPAARDADGLLFQSFVPLAAIRGDAPPPVRLEAVRVEASVAGTALLFGDADGARLRWEAISADEALIDHVAQAPAVEEPMERRLRWFAGRLEHPNTSIAADAFTEFGLAPFESVCAVADAFDVARLRTWLDDEAIDRRRRGFYGLALGLTARSSGGADRAASVGDHGVVAPGACRPDGCRGASGGDDGYERRQAQRVCAAAPFGGGGAGASSGCEGMAP